LIGNTELEEERAMHWIIRIMGAAVLGLALLFASAGLAAAQEPVSVLDCIQGEGTVEGDDESPTGLICGGGLFEDIPVSLSECQSQAPSLPALPVQSGIE